MPNSRLRRFDGQYRWVLDNGIPFYAPDGTFTGYIGSCIDITERRSLEQQLQYSEQKLRSLVEANILGVIVADLDGRIYESNDCFAQTLGYSTDELLAETFRGSTCAKTVVACQSWQWQRCWIRSAVSRWGWLSTSLRRKQLSGANRNFCAW